MQHPLHNPSLAPYGFVFPLSKIRLEHKPPYGGVNAERVIARLWDKLHRRDASGQLPIETIVHRVLPGMAKAHELREREFDFRGLPYLGRDIALLSTAVQWFGCNCGSCFLETSMGMTFSHPEREFTEKFEREAKRCDMVANWTHFCTERCRQQSVPLNMFSCPHYFDSTTVTDRDRAVVKALMWWLGKKEGRSFASQIQDRIKAAEKVVREQQLAGFRREAAAFPK